MNTPKSDHAGPRSAANLQVTEVGRASGTRRLDEPIPVLAGHTPRQAAADPTRRGDLIRLLDSLHTSHDNPGVINLGRLRTALDQR